MASKVPKLVVPVLMIDSHTLSSSAISCKNTDTQYPDVEGKSSITNCDSQPQIIPVCAVEYPEIKPDPDEEANGVCTSKQRQETEKSQDQGIDASLGINMYEVQVKQEPMEHDEEFNSALQFYSEWQAAVPTLNIIAGDSDCDGAKSVKQYCKRGRRMKRGARRKAMTQKYDYDFIGDPRDFGEELQTDDAEYIPGSTVQQSSSEHQVNTKVRIVKEESYFNDTLGLYCCLHCEYKVGRRHLFRLHLRRTHATHNPSVCPQCNKEYRDEQKLLNHMRVYHALPENSTCDLCGKQLCNKQSMREHKKLMHGDKMFVCSIDGKAFGTQKSLRRHTESVHDGIDTFVRLEEELCCPLCSYHTDRQMLFNKHMRTTHAPSEPSECNQCGKVFGNAQKLKSHIWKFHNVSTEELVCKTCGRTLCNKQSLLEHQRNVHNEQKTFVCEFDGKAFGTHMSLQRHLRYAHNGLSDSSQPPSIIPVEDLTCKQCGWVSHKQENLRKHIKRVHVEQQVTCDHCCKQFANPARLASHMAHVKRVMKTQNQFQCDVCGKHFTTEGSLDEHRQGIHGTSRDFLCPHDGKSFATAIKLKRHLTSCHKNNAGHASQETGTYICEFCGYIAEKKYQLSNHKHRMHGPDEPSPCPYCGKVFDTDFKMKKHIRRMHRLHMPLVCSVCNKTLQRTDSLRAHMKRKHKDVAQCPVPCEINDSNLTANQSNDIVCEHSITPEPGIAVILSVDNHSKEDNNSAIDHMDTLGNSLNLSSSEDDGSEVFSVDGTEEYSPAQNDNIIHETVKSNSNHSQSCDSGMDVPTSNIKSINSQCASVSEENTDEGPSRLWCKLCEEYFADSSRLSRHMWEDHF